MKSAKYVVIETTTHCNLKCSYCNREDVVGDKLKHMSYSNFQEISNKILAQHSVSDLKLMSMGEPFMNPEIGSIFKYAREKFRDAHIICATNCQHTNYDDFEIALNNLDEIYLSIDGIEEVYEEMRFPGKWKKVINFLTIITKLDRSAKLTINMVVSEKNYHHIEKVLHLAKQFEIDNFKINIAQEWSVNNKMKVNLSQNLLSVLKKYEKYIAGKREWDFKDCFWPNNGIYIDTFGMLRICNIKTDSKPIGNINNDLLQDIIRNNEELIRVREGCKNNEPELHCKNCSYKELTYVFSKIQE